MVTFWVKTAVDTFWATFVKFGQLFISTSGHTDGPQRKASLEGKILLLTSSRFDARRRRRRRLHHQHSTS